MDNSSVILLSDAIKNKSYKICSFKPDTLLDIKKLYNVGLTEDTDIIPLYDSMIKGSVAYLIKGCVVAIRNKDASDIFVRENL